MTKAETGETRFTREAGADEASGSSGDAEMSNMSKVRAMADKMVKELQLNPQLGLPDWAGLAWAMSPYYNSRSYLVYESMPFEWLHRAKRIVAAMDVAWQARREAALDSRCGVRK